MEKSKKIWTNYKKRLDKIRIFIFGFKIYPFLKSDDKVKLLESITLYINKIKEYKKYKLFLKYFKKIGKTQILLILILSEMKILSLGQIIKQKYFID